MEIVRLRAGEEVRLQAIRLRALRDAPDAIRKRSFGDRRSFTGKLAQAALHAADIRCGQEWPRRRSRSLRTRRRARGDGLAHFDVGGFSTLVAK